MWLQPGDWCAAGEHIGNVLFLHPDDVANNRPQQDTVRWELKAPVDGYFFAINPNVREKPIVSSDLTFNDWLLCLRDVPQYSWDQLLTHEEYLHHVANEPNLLGIYWTRSSYSRPSIQNRFSSSKPEPTLRESVKEILRGQEEAEKSRETKL